MDEANDLFSDLPIVVAILGLLDAMRVKKHASREIERNPMFAQVRFGFRGIPFEFHIVSILQM